jgi:hypothetical protein
MDIIQVKLKNYVHDTQKQIIEQLRTRDKQGWSMQRRSLFH